MKYIAALEHEEHETLLNNARERRKCLCVCTGVVIAAPDIRAWVLLCVTVYGAVGCAESPPVNGTAIEIEVESQYDVRESLAASMANMHVLAYRDTWDVVAEGATESNGLLRLFYTQRLVDPNDRASGENQSEPDYWNREHVWPQSYGLKDTPARTDVHNLVPVDQTVNSERGNRWFADSEQRHHECTICGVSRDTWSPPPEVRGDVARIAFYMDVRYEGLDIDGVSDLSLGESPDPRFRRFGLLSTLLKWHCADPVSDVERRRHEAAARAQGNRNAFIDEPALVGSVFGITC